MPDPKLYFSYLELSDGSKKYVKDADARADIAEIKEAIKNGSHFLGTFVSAVVGGETVSTLHDGDVVTSITTSEGTFVTGTPAEGETKLSNGDYTIVNQTAGKPSLEFMWTGSKFSEFGSTSVLKALAYKDNASGAFTPAGTNAASEVTFDANAGSNFATGYNNDGVADTFQEGAFTPAEIQSGFATPGVAAQFSEGAFTPASFQAGFVTPGVAPSFSEGAFTPASLAEGFVTPGVAPSFSEGAFNAGALASLTYDAQNEGLVFAAGTLPSKTADTFTAGSPTAIDTTKFSGGSKASDTFTAGSPTAIDTTKFDGGSKAADTFVANTPTAIDTTKFSGGSKAADVFTPGSVPTLAVAKAITATDTAEAAAQVFTGTEGTVTVS